MAKIFANMTRNMNLQFQEISELQTEERDGFYTRTQHNKDENKRQRKCLESSQRKIILYLQGRTIQMTEFLIRNHSRQKE